MSISKKTFQFLKELKQHNNRKWFQDNKPRYLDALAEMEEFLSRLIPAIRSFDGKIKFMEPKQCIFRIYRDVRFSKDKTPYKISLGAHVLPEGRKKAINKAGYYLHIEPGNCFLAGGTHNPPSSWLNNIRGHIDKDAKTLKKIINSAGFKKYFKTIRGEQLKTTPRDYPKDHPDIDLLRYKSLLAIHRVPDAKVLSSSFLKHCVTVFKTLKPFDDFLNGK